MTLTKADIIDAIYMKLGHSKAHSAKVVESLLEIIKQTLANGEDLLISGFGKFCVKNKRKLRGRNPQTGEDVMLGSRRVGTFKCSGILRDRINGKGTVFILQAFVQRDIAFLFSIRSLLLFPLSVIPLEITSFLPTLTPSFTTL